ncbi:protein of unknown function (plasmid) [Cupriavidus taiwanensis]|uniref:Uncharacterized protein n=1 Tax=Cupriavidus taiwanensis TaxID=164546 RepID=A0A7Z7NND1_9BURK|nr:protein of unknown function [Cupriavidus taiwanensis]SOZ13193.1 protein of unknown function [Cupriavidus taiwanensis]SOZ41904.1 protein of unknown function [Cupriavidus taiwanensis]SPC21101.1 protein of unknown function [Cupriavidus taiwanensis]SPD55244.1 protein of unknown function [Cupriavidus taiwanensis]
MTRTLFCSTLPLAGEGPGERAGAGNHDSPHFVEASALSPTLSRKREREPASGRFQGRAPSHAKDRLR